MPNLDEVLIRALFQHASKTKRAHTDACRTLKNACLVDKASNGLCDTLNSRSDLSQVLTACGRMFVQITHIGESDTAPTVWYIPMDKGLFDDDHRDQVLVQDIAHEEYLDLDGERYLDWDEDATHWNKQWALYEKFTFDKSMTRLPEGGVIFCYIHLINTK